MVKFLIFLLWSFLHMLPVIVGIGGFVLVSPLYLVTDYHLIVTAFGTICGIYLGTLTERELYKIRYYRLY